MKSLYESISALSVSDDFELHFKILNISKGWKLASKLTCDRTTLNKLIRYVAYAYSAESGLLRKRKERHDNKMNIISVLEIDCDSYVMDCIKNLNVDFNRFVTWFLRESEDRDFSFLISLEDAMFSLLELAREGIDRKITITSAKEAERALKIFNKTEVLIKAEATKKAMEIKYQIEALEKQLEKSYEYLRKVVREDSSDIANNLGWAEKMVLKSRNK